MMVDYCSATAAVNPGHFNQIGFTELDLFQLFSQGLYLLFF
jgi:hypothetical protein